MLNFGSNYSFLFEFANPISKAWRSISFPQVFITKAFLRKDEDL